MPPLTKPSGKTADKEAFVGQPLEASLLGIGRKKKDKMFCRKRSKWKMPSISANRLLHAQAVQNRMVCLPLNKSLSRMLT